jgi:hypothetical protein
VKRELRVIVLVIALVVGGLEALISALQSAPAPAVETATAAPPPAPAISSPGPACDRFAVGHYPQIGFLQSVPAELPCD